MINSLASHTGGRPLKEEGCLKAFWGKAKLKRWQKTELGELSYEGMGTATNPGKKQKSRIRATKNSKELEVVT